MNTRRPIQQTGVIVALIFSCHTTLLWADDTQDLKKELEQMREQNHLMEQQLEKQQMMIEQLTRKVNDLAQPAAPASQAPSGLAASQSAGEAAPNSGSGFALGNLHISGEGGVGFFETGKNGAYPNAEFRVDEARLFLDAPIWNEVYFYGELDLQTREEQAPDSLTLGELYLDFEDVAQWWNQEHLLNVRAGQMYTPFGEEYQARYAIDNPLISHSLSDLWALSPGLELYGGIGRFSYAVAVQSGGYSILQDNTADKSVAGRVGYDPNSWLHVSASAMRTGDISVQNDFITAMWFGNGFFQSIGSKSTTLFHADLAELDGQVKWRHGSWKTAAGYADYNDNDPKADNHRDIYYYYTELVQGITQKLYGAVRLSQIDAPAGYPMPGNNPNDFSVLTKDLWRLSLGAGYRFSPHLTVKGEYMLEHGEQSDGAPRNHEDLIGIEAAFKF